MRSMIPRGVDWHSRKDLSWRLSNSMDAQCCVEALKEALAKHGTPEIFNTDQGRQLTSGAWIGVLMDAKAKIGMPLGTLLRNALTVIDGNGAWRANRMIARLWRSLKYGCVYLHAFERGSEAKAGIRAWRAYDNADRPHSLHGILSPDEHHASKTEPMGLAT